MMPKKNLNIFVPENSNIEHLEGLLKKALTLAGCGMCHSGYRITLGPIGDPEEINVIGDIKGGAINLRNIE